MKELSCVSTTAIECDIANLGLCFEWDELIRFGLTAGLYLDSTKVSELVVDTERGGTIQINVSASLFLLCVGASSI